MFEYGAFVLVADEGKVLISEFRSQGEREMGKKKESGDEKQEQVE